MSGWDESVRFGPLEPVRQYLRRESENPRGMVGRIRVTAIQIGGEKEFIAWSPVTNSTILTLMVSGLQAFIMSRPAFILEEK